MIRRRSSAQIAHYEQENENLRARIAASRGQAGASWRQLQEQLRQQQTEAAAERQRVEARRTGTDRKAQEKNRELLTLQSDVARLEQKKSTAAMEEKQIVDRLWDNYELTRTTARNLTPAEGDPPGAAEADAASCGARSARWVRPNLGAIDEYARVNERYTYLTEPAGRRGEVRSRELLGVIRDITGEMTGIFPRTVPEDRRVLPPDLCRDVRRRHARQLELEDESNPLDCGIEIRGAAARQGAQDPDAALRRREGFRGHCALFCYPAGAAHAVLSAG